MTGLLCRALVPLTLQRGGAGVTKTAQESGGHIRIKKETEYSHGSEDRLRAVNLNLLPILRELLRLRKVSEAAQALNMSQSAVSDALARLRHIFQDELLIPSGRTFTLSDKAKEIEAITLEALDKFEALLNTKPFNPREATGKIQIAASDSIVLTLGMPLLRSIRTAGARISVHFHGSRDSRIQGLISGLIDFAVVYGYEAPQVAPTLKVTHLFDDALVLIAGLKLAQSIHLDREGLDEIRRLAITQGANGRGMLVDEMFLQQAADAQLQTVLMPALRLLPLIAQSQNTLSIIPQRLAERLAPGDRFRVIEFELPKITAFALWNQSRANDPLHQWVLRTLTDVGRATAEHPPVHRNHTGEK
jgi:DNA-binding transcriptional LysR family regulator